MRSGRPDELPRFVVAFFSVVVVAAGASGVALLLAPASTERYFSWTPRPAAAAALIGGFYLASAVVFGWALTLPWRQARALVVGVLGLAVPTLVLTLVHDEVFDFGRWQDVARVGPVDLVRLTGTYLGAWCSFLAVLCGWAAARGAWDHARAPLVTVAVAAGGAIVAFLRSLGELRPPGGRRRRGRGAARGRRRHLPPEPTG